MTLLCLAVVRGGLIGRGADAEARSPPTPVAVCDRFRTQPAVAASACSMSFTKRLASWVNPPAWIATSYRSTVDPARADMTACRLDR